MDVIVHGFDQPWSTSAPASLSLSTQPADGTPSGSPAMLLSARDGAAGASAEYVPGAPLDLSGAGELRLWTRADRRVDGTAARPFLVELGYTDAADALGEEHRWLLPVARPGTWEQHRIGVEQDRRGAVTRFTLRCLTDRPLEMSFDELLAVADEPLVAAESALVATLAEPVLLPGAHRLPLLPAPAGATELRLTPVRRRLRPRNRILVDPGPGGPQESYDVTGVAHDETAGETRLTLDPAHPLRTPAGAGATLTVQVPVLVEEAPLDGPADPGTLPDPVLLVELSDLRDDPARAGQLPQRDSFRRRGDAVVCAVRPPARPVLAEYRLLPAARDREQSLLVRAAVLGRLGLDRGLRAEGTHLPVTAVPAPVLDTRDRGVLAPVVVQIGTRVETGARRELPLVRDGGIRVAPADAPRDQETVDVPPG